jgi:hypothetical protein
MTRADGFSAPTGPWCKFIEPETAKNRAVTRDFTLYGRRSLWKSAQVTWVPPFFAQFSQF